MSITEVKIVTKPALLARRNIVFSQDDIKSGVAASIAAELKATAKLLDAKRPRNKKILGLSATQIDIPKTVCIVRKNSGRWITMINPTVENLSSEAIINYETCLSFPDKPFEVTRHKSVTVKYYNEKGKLILKTFKGKLGRRVEHELDHINGVVPSKRQFEKGALYVASRKRGF